MTGRSAPVLGIAALVVGVLAFAAVSAGVLPAPVAPGGPATSPAAAPATPTSPTPPPTPRPIPKHEVYGYLPYWEMDEAIHAHLAGTALTTLALFSVTHQPDGEMDEAQTGYRRIAGGLGRRILRDAHARGTRVELVYSSFGPERNRAFLEDAAAQARWTEVLVNFAAERGFDGINVDIERLPIDLVPAFGGFVGRLRDALRERLPDGQVSVATQANELGAAMAAVAAAAGADRVFLMGYDYRWSGSEPGATAPLDRVDGGTKDLAWSLDLYESLGVPVDRTILGLPLYGMTWPVAGPDFGAPSTGRGSTWVPRRNLRVFANPSFAPYLDPIESVEFYSVPASPPPPSRTPGPGEPEPGQGWNAVYYDSPRSLAPKLALADERGLAGTGFWAIGYERGVPGHGELLRTFRAGDLRLPFAP